MKQEREDKDNKPKRKWIGWLASIGLTIYAAFTLLGTGRPICSTRAEMGCMLGGAFLNGLAVIAALGLLLFVIGISRRRKNIKWTGRFMRFLLLAGSPLSLAVWLAAFYDDPGELVAIRIGLTMNIIAFAVTLLSRSSWKRKHYEKLLIAALGLAGFCYAFFVLETRQCPEKLSPGQTANMCWKESAYGPGAVWYSERQGYDKNSLMIDPTRDFNENQ